MILLMLRTIQFDSVWFCRGFADGQPYIDIVSNAAMFTKSIQSPLVGSTVANRRLAEQKRASQIGVDVLPTVPLDGSVNLARVRPHSALVVY